MNAPLPSHTTLPGISARSSSGIRPRTDAEEPAPSAPIARPRPGDILGHQYRVDCAIGEGGMGAVYAATCLRLGRRVALKVLLPELSGSARCVSRFRREAEAASQLHHPNVVQILDYRASTTTELPFIVMELLEGESLQSLVNRARFSPERAIRIAAQLLSGLAAAHSRDIVHRDVKPSNVFVTPLADGTEIVKLLDFGIARVVDPTEPRLTLRGSFLGSTHYASPEQAAGRECDGRSDLFSVGSILYRMVTGARPFEGPSVEVVAKIVEHEAPDPRALIPGLAPQLAAVIGRAMRKCPSARYATATEMASALGAPGAAAAGADEFGPRPPLARTQVMTPLEVGALREAEPTEPDRAVEHVAPERGRWSLALRLALLAALATATGAGVVLTLFALG